jgi:hypothetical protein
VTSLLRIHRGGKGDEDQGGLDGIDYHEDGRESVNEIEDIVTNFHLNFLSIEICLPALSFSPSVLQSLSVQRK